MKKIAVVGSRGSYNKFIRMVNPLDTNKFVNINRIEKARGQEFATVVELECRDYTHTYLQELREQCLLRVRDYAPD